MTSKGECCNLVRVLTSSGYGCMGMGARRQGEAEGSFHKSPVILRSWYQAVPFLFTKVNQRKVRVTEGCCHRSCTISVPVSVGNPQRAQFHYRPNSLYCGHPRDSGLGTRGRELVSLIAGIYFSQTSVIYFCRDLSTVRIILVSVCINEVSVRRELTQYSGSYKHKIRQVAKNQ